MGKSPKCPFCNEGVEVNTWSTYDFYHEEFSCGANYVTNDTIDDANVCTEGLTNAYINNYLWYDYDTGKNVRVKKLRTDTHYRVKQRKSK